MTEVKWIDLEIERLELQIRKLKIERHYKAIGKSAYSPSDHKAYYAILKRQGEIFDEKTRYQKETGDTMNNSKTIRAWHFSNGSLRYGDNRLIEAGLSLACKPDQIELCKYGYHASVDILDALSYAPHDTNTISLVELGGRILEDTDKHVASIRRHLVVADCERTLHEFAIWCAEQALALISDPDPRSIEALAVKRRWLDGKVPDEKLAAARDAARAVAGTAWDAARAAAWAAWDAARAAAWNGAWAAGDAVWPAAGAAQSKMLENMVMALPEFQEATLQ